jgi:hypothetical protein
MTFLSIEKSENQAAAMEAENPESGPWTQVA